MSHRLFEALLLSSGVATTTVILATSGVVCSWAYDDLVKRGWVPPRRDYRTENRPDEVPSCSKCGK